MSEAKVFSTEIVVQVIHLNYANHLGHDATLSILHEARLRWIKSFDQQASETNFEKNIGWVIRSLNISYESEAQYGDTILCELFVKNLKKTSLEIVHTATNQSTGKILCHCETKLVFSDRTTFKVARIPDRFYDFVSSSMAANTL